MTPTKPSPETGEPSDMGMEKAGAFFEEYQSFDPYPSDIVTLARFYDAARAEGEAAGLERAAKIAEAIWLPDKSGSVVAAALRALTPEGKR